MRIFAISDIVAPRMRAHKARPEGKVAAEVAAGQRSYFDAKAIPSVAYTDPEIAWVGLTETEAKAAGICYGKGVFPWAASDRSPTLGELIAEVAPAIDMGADAIDIGLTVHPHPAWSETIGLAAEAFDGTVTDLYQPERN